MWFGRMGGLEATSRKVDMSPIASILLIFVLSRELLCWHFWSFRLPMAKWDEKDRERGKAWLWLKSKTETRHWWWSSGRQTLWIGEASIATLMVVRSGGGCTSDRAECLEENGGVEVITL